MSGVILEAKNISKTFPGVKALTNVSITLKEGEVHSVVGENGAGKSTLMKIISGIYSPDEGTMTVAGKRVNLKSVTDAFNNGIAIVHQELVNCQNVTVMENIYMHKISSGKSFINWRELNKQAAEELNKFKLNVSPNTKMSELSVSEQQIVEIVKALSVNAKVIIFDEPTASLTETETENLFKIIAELKQHGVGILYISHRMEEICSISDRITVLRDGQYIDTLDGSCVDKVMIVNKMIGRELVDYYPKKSSGPGEVMFEAKEFSHEKYFNDISFDLRKNEIHGFFGLVGCGRSELAKSICGIDTKVSGDVVLNGETLKIKEYADAVKNGIVYLTEDRKTEGLFLEMSVKQNVSALYLDNIKGKYFLSNTKESAQADKYCSRMKTKCSSLNQKCMNLSGGNQQKVLIAKALSINPKLIILDEPTKGIDVGAKSEIYNMLRELAEQGVGVIVISSDMSEVIGLCDRVTIIHEGQVVGEARDEEINEKFILHRASGI